MPRADKIKIYPLSARANPPPTRLLSPQGKPWSQTQLPDIEPLK
jgi:hypothetical protein